MSLDVRVSVRVSDCVCPYQILSALEQPLVPRDIEDANASSRPQSVNVLEHWSANAPKDSPSNENIMVNLPKIPR